MDRLLRLGIVGMGFGAKVHLPAFLSIPGIKVVAVADTGSGRASQAVANLNVPYVFNHWRELIDKADIEVISVVTPPKLHIEIVAAALEAGQHILCEKPFGRDLSEARQMFDASQNKQSIHAVDFQFRMEPGIEMLKHQIETGAIGQVMRIDVSWMTGGRSDPASPWSWQHDAKLGGGVLNGFGSHVIDYIQWITQSSIIQVFAQAHILVEYRKNVDGQLCEVTAEDDCDLVCNLANGAIATLKFSNCYPFGLGHRIEIYGSEGRLVYCHKKPFLPNDARVYSETKSGVVSPIPLKSLPTRQNLDSRILAFRKLASNFVEAIHGYSCHNLPTFAHALNVQQVLEAAQNSIKYQKPYHVKREDVIV